MADFDSYPSSPLQRFGLALIFFFPALAVIVLGLRLYSKIVCKSLGPGTFRHPSTLFGPDDVLACISMVFSIGLTVGSYYYIKSNYVGIDYDKIPPHDTWLATISTYVIQVLYFPVLAFIKSSVLFFLLRLGGQKPGVRWVIYGMNGLNFSFMIAVLGVAIGQCQPVSYYWDPSAPGGHCIDRPVFYLIQSGVNILTDIATLGIPIWIFLHLKMARRLKIATLYVFLLGFIVTVIGTVRFVFLYMLFYADYQSIENYTMSFCLSSVETNLAIVCACAPTLRGLVRSWFPQTLANADEYGATEEDDDAPNMEDRSPSTSGGGSGGGGGIRNSVRCSHRHSSHRFGLSGDGLFGYPKDGRGRVICSHAAQVEGLGLSPSEEEIMAYNGILRTTDVVVEHGDESSLNRPETGTGKEVERTASGDSG